MDPLRIFSTVLQWRTFQGLLRMIRNKNGYILMCDYKQTKNIVSCCVSIPLMHLFCTSADHQ